MAIVLATVVPVLAAKTPLRLADAAVTPGSVTEGDTVTFRVTYRNLDAVAAASVKVEFDGQSYALSPVKSKKNVVAGIRYEATVRPEAGSGPVRFVATDQRGRSVSLTAGTLTVEALPPPVAPPSDPPPSDPPPSDPPPSDPPPSDPPPSTPPPSDPGGTGSGGTGGSGSSGEGGSGSSGSDPSPSDGDASEGASSAGGAEGAGTEPDSDRPSEVPMSGLPPTVPDEPVTAAIDPGVPDPGASGAGTPGRADSRGSETVAAFGAAGIVAFRPAPDPLAAVLPVLVTTLGGATMVMAFMVFGKRRRDGEPTDSDMALATAAATGSGAVASAALVDAPLGSPARPAAPPVDAEMAMPRWRRPSLLEARKADPLRTATAPVVSLSFDHGMVDPVAGRERRRIRYRVVRLLDGPDELTALDVGVLDAGDEVQLLERSGVYWFVLCPDGQRGWVHKMVLGDVVEEPEDVPGPGARATGPRQAGEDALAARLAAVDAPTAMGAVGGSEPVGYDAVMTPAAWTLRGASPTDAGLDVDDDVMRAFLASQGRG